MYVVLFIFNLGSCSSAETLSYQQHVVLLNHIPYFESESANTGIVEKLQAKCLKPSVWSTFGKLDLRKLAVFFGHGLNGSLRLYLNIRSHKGRHLNFTLNSSNPLSPVPTPTRRTFLSFKSARILETSAAAILQ